MDILKAIYKKNGFVSETQRETLPGENNEQGLDKGVLCHPTYSSA
jgi:hypothetical protein